MARHRVQCPATACAALFEVEEFRLGRNVHCPDCGTRLTARPAALTAELRRRERQRAAAAGAPIRRLHLAALVDNVRSLWNVGSIFRTADSCAVERLVLTGITACPPRVEISKTALGAEEVVPWCYRADPAAAVGELAAAGYEPVVLECGQGSVALDRFAWPDRPCLIVGNEVAGVAPAVLRDCARRVRIPMRGIKGSLNVAVAFGIAAHSAAAALEARSAATAAR